MNLVTQQPATLGAANLSLDAKSDLLAEFFCGCRSLESEPGYGEPPPRQDYPWRKAVAFLAHQGVISQVLEFVSARFCGSEYPKLLADLQRDFGTDALVALGAVVRGVAEYASMV